MNNIASVRRSLRSSTLESCPTQGVATNHVTPAPFWCSDALGRLPRQRLQLAPSSSRNFLVAHTREPLALGWPAHLGPLCGLGSPKPPDTMSADGKGAAVGDSRLACTRSVMQTPTQWVRLKINESAGPLFIAPPCVARSTLSENSFAH
jgi:hypothetical protein